METRFNESIHRIYYMFKLNTMVILGILCGGCMLSSLVTAIEMHHVAKNVSTLLSFKQWWRKFKVELKQTAMLSWLYNMVCLMLLWALWFTSQFKGFIFFSAWLIQLAVLISTILVMLAEAHLRQHYEGDWKQIVKLSWIQLFMSPKANFYTFGYGIILLIVGYQFPAIVAFWGLGTWISFFSNNYFEEWRRLKII